MSAHPQGFSAASLVRYQALGYTTAGTTLAAAAFDLLTAWSDTGGVPALGVAGRNVDTDMTAAPLLDSIAVAKRGLYKVSFKSLLNLGGAATFTFQIYVNGAALPALADTYNTQIVTGGVATNVPVSLDALLYLEPGDTVEVWKNSDAVAGATAINCNCSTLMVVGPWN